MSHKKLRPFIVKVSVLGYFPLSFPINIYFYYNYNTKYLLSLNVIVICSSPILFQLH